MVENNYDLRNVRISLAVHTTDMCVCIYIYIYGGGGVFI